MEINKIELVSIGIDIGSSTSHLVFSNLILIKDAKSATQRFVIKERNVIHEGRIIDTPLLDDKTIDIDKLTAFFKEECDNAGLDPDDIQTGAVIVTGETAKKQNAPQIAEALSKDAGKFVAATAGPNFESLLAAMGSGATARSKEHNKTILSCDIGGGTSNLAISQNGDVLSTSCVSVGGRLIALDSDGKICRLNEPALKVMKDIGLDYKIGDPVPQEGLERITSRLAEVLIEVMTGPAISSLSKQLMVTDDMNFPKTINEYIFSGGVAEFIYGDQGNYNDIGKILSDKIVSMTPKLNAPVVEPVNKIRATVIGAGAYSLSISGSSGFMDDKLAFPIMNIPVLRVDVEESRLSTEHVVSKINAAFQRYDLIEGQETVALYFKDPVRVNYPALELFAKSLETALSNSIDRKTPVILIFEKDIACSVGNVIRRETSLKENLLSLDELSLNDGDWIDISEPLVGHQVFPVTVKSLVFPMNE
ncbi:MAG: ethanolamine ammonia-lyase reactivating factor EutA [Thermodesulfobacteriota bacterium]|nr:ethanolamine ammonia-lyase reactivating factor EutA [Thermodesulfobacteriota bacterium]